MQHLLASCGAQNTVPVSLLANVSNPALPCWEFIARRLPARDAETEWYSLADIAPLVGLTPNSLSKHARDLWPRHTGHWRLNHAEAVRLIRRVCVAGKKLPKEVHQ